MKWFVRILLGLAVCWCVMTGVDAGLCARGKDPVFALRQEVTDCSLYRGLGYTIRIGFDGICGQAGEPLNGKFWWGWGDSGL